MSDNRREVFLSREPGRVHMLLAVDEERREQPEKPNAQDYVRREFCSPEDIDELVGALNFAKSQAFNDLEIQSANQSGVARASMIEMLRNEQLLMLEELERVGLPRTDHQKRIVMTRMDKIMQVFGQIRKVRLLPADSVLELWGQYSAKAKGTLSS